MNPVYLNTFMKWRVWLVLFALAALVAIAIIDRAQFKQAFHLILTVGWPILLLIPIVQLLSFYTNAKYYQTFLANFGYHPSITGLYKLSLALNFVNQIAPSIGITGVTFISYTLHKDGVPAGKGTLAQSGRYVLTYISFAILLVLALFM